MKNSTRKRSLLGKYIFVTLSGKHKPSGQRKVRVSKVCLAHGEIKFLTVRLYNPETDKWDGKKMRILPNEFQPTSVNGIVYRNKLYPLLEWMNG